MVAHELAKAGFRTSFGRGRERAFDFWNMAIDLSNHIRMWYLPLSWDALLLSIDF